MMIFPDFDSIKSWYDTTPKLWTKDMVGEAVECNKITADQYKEIIGEDYQSTTTPDSQSASESTSESTSVSA